MKTMAKTVLLSLALPILAVNAQTPALVDGSGIETVLQAAKSFGMAELKKDVSGDPMIEGKIEGKLYSIYFYDCDTQKKSCDSMMFSSSWLKEDGIDLQFVNDWNNRVRYGVVSLDAEGDVLLNLSLNLKGGISQENLVDNLDIWRSVLLRFEAEAKKTLEQIEQ